MGIRHGNCWKGGRRIRPDGYWTIYMPEHPRADSPGYVREHIVIAEKALGKPLPEGVVIHHAGETTDNTKLVICQDRAYHFLLHRRMRALRACGHASWRRCWICGKHDKPENLYISPNNRGVCHKACMKRYNRKKYEAKGLSV